MDTTSPEPAPLAGIYLPLITPFRDGALDESSLARLCAHYSAAPLDGFVLAATTGEGLVLDAEETGRLVGIAASALGRDRPIYLGLSGSDTRALQRRLDATSDWPIAGYLIACPYYTRPSQEGLRRHFAALAAASAKPIILYNIPYRTGVNLGNETLLRLAELPAIIGIKDCSADAAQSFDLLRRRPAGFAVLTGEDALFYGALAHGADGGSPRRRAYRSRRLCRAACGAAGGRRRWGARRWSALVDLVRLLFAEPNPAPLKHWLWRAGLIASPELRLPMTGVSPALAGQLDRLLWARRAA